MITYRLYTAIILLGLIIPIQSTALLADNLLPTKTEFIRIDRDIKNKPLSLDTAIVQYQPNIKTSDGITVDLIAAVHIADTNYYQTLNKLFKNYDAVLYELVAPEGTKIKADNQNTSNHPVGKLQVGLKNLLELSFQLEQIDYSKNNFVHADMTPEALSKSMEERGESFIQIIIRMVAQSIVMEKRGNGANDLNILMAMMSKNRAMKLKKILAQQFEDLEIAMLGIDGPKDSNGLSGSTIITERNRKALDVLAQQIKLKKKKIAIFYGAGHMPNMEKQLMEKFKLHRGKQSWLPAWMLIE